jgi:hypothetical protein
METATLCAIVDAGGSWTMRWTPVDRRYVEECQQGCMSVVCWNAEKYQLML